MHNVKELKEDRVKYWISKGAQLSATVNNLLVGNGVIEGEKVQTWKPKRKSKDEAESKKEDKTEKETKEVKDSKTSKKTL